MPTMPSTRYPEENEYGREPPRGIRRQREPDVGDRERDRREPVIRDVRPERTPTQRMDIEPQRLSREPDVLRGDQQRLANSGVPRQQDVRAPRNVPATRDRDDEMMYDMPRTQYAPREQQARRPYEGEFDEIPAPIRPVIDPSRSSRDEPRPNYNEYFLPGDGIDREVIQSEICRYLGQDATCKPGTHGDGRRGYIIRAYRALTTEMIRSLKEDSAKYAREREIAARNRRMPVPYATVRDQTRYGGGDEMMLDEPEDRERDRYPRHVDEPRLRNPAVTSAYIPEAGYSSAQGFYPVTTTQTAPAGYVDPRDPRYIPGNTTPPGISGRNPGYAAGYAPVTTRPTAPGIPAAAPFPDSRSNPRDTGYGYPPEPRVRHR